MSVTELFLSLQILLFCIVVANAQPLPSYPFPGWKSVSYTIEDPTDVAIDTNGGGSIFVALKTGLDVLLGGNLPKITIYSTLGSKIYSVQLIHRLCGASSSTSSMLIYGLFFSVKNKNFVKYLPLPLPANPSQSNVQPNVKTVLSGLWNPYAIVQTYNSMQLYVAEYNNGQVGARVSHWAVSSPANGGSVPGLKLIRHIGNLGYPRGVAITRDDNMLFVSSQLENKMYKVTSLLSANPISTEMVFTEALNWPQQLVLHPLHNQADDYVLYVGNSGKGNILRYTAYNEKDEVFIDVNRTSGYRPHGITLMGNGSIIIMAEDGLKVSCCVEAFDPFTTLAAYRNSSDCLPTAPVQYSGWDPVSFGVENPHGTVIDYAAGDIYVSLHQGMRLVVLRGGNLPKITIYSSTAGVVGLQLMHRVCTSSKLNVSGIFFTEVTSGLIKFLPLPLPLNPTSSIVEPTIQTVASGLLHSYWLTQTYNSMQLYVAEYNNGQVGARVSHWAVSSPANGGSVPGLKLIRHIDNVGYPRGVAITRDDNMLFVSSPEVDSKMYKVTSLLSANPISTEMVFTETLSWPQPLVLHPLHNKADDYVLYVGNTGKGNILRYTAYNEKDEVFIDVNKTSGYRPHGITLMGNGSIIIMAEDGLKVSCCVEAFDPFTTLAAYRNGSDCLPTSPVQYPGWDPVSFSVEDPHDTVIDYAAGDIYVSLHQGKRLVVLRGGNLPKITIYSSASGLVGLQLMHRVCTSSKLIVSGIFFTEISRGLIKFLPLPLPLNPTASNVEPIIQTVASGLLWPVWFTQTYNSMQLYVAEYNNGQVGARVSHWAVSSPANGGSVPGLKLIRHIDNVGYPVGVAITRDDNMLFVSPEVDSKMYKVTSLLSANPISTEMVFTQTIHQPQQLLLHPLHNKAEDYHLYVGNLHGGNLLQYDSASEPDEVFIDVNSASGYRPHGIAFARNGSIIIAAQDGLKVSCCVEAFDPFTTLAAYRNGSDCLPTSPVQYPGWDPVDILVENPHDAVVDYATGDIYVCSQQGKRLVVLRGGNLPKITIYSSTAELVGLQLMHRVCTSSKLNVSGIFFTEVSSGLIKFLPLPLPLNPTSSIVEPTIQTVASGLLRPVWFTQTYNSMQLYLAECNNGQVGAHVSHWAISSPVNGGSVPGLKLIRNIGNLGYPVGVAITRDDNMLFVSSSSKMYKVTSLLSGIPISTEMVFTQTIRQPRQLVLHPLHNKAEDYHLYVGNLHGGNLLQYDSASEPDEVFIDVNSASGYRPYGIAFASNGSIIIMAEDGLKVSCCVEAFDPFTTLAAYRNGSDCLPTSPVQYPGWDSVDVAVENPHDAVIDYATGDIYVCSQQGKRLVVLRGGNLPKITIYSSTAGLVGLQLMHRVCTSSKLIVSGIFFTEVTSGLIKFLPLPLPLNPTSSIVEPTIQTVASGLLKPVWFTQTYNLMQLYVAEHNNEQVGAHVSHWAISSPVNGGSVPGLKLIRNIGNLGYPVGVAITRDDNMLFVSSTDVDSKMYKVTSLLSGIPISTEMVFTQTIRQPRQLVLHPLHSKAEDYVLYLTDLHGGNILRYDSNSEPDEVFIDANTKFGYRPYGITFASNGSIIIVAQDGLKVSCCVEAFDPFTTLAAYRNSSDCLPTAPVQYSGWDPVSFLVENPLDTVIDYATGDIYVSLHNGQRLVVLRGGNLPKITIYSSTSGLVGLQLMHRVCTSSKLNVSGIFFTEVSSGLIKFLPLPLPLNPTSSNVKPTIQTVASGLLQPFWFTQTYNSMQLYVAECNSEQVGAHVSHWAVSSPVNGGSVPGLKLIRNIDNVGYPRGVAITRDDNMLFVSSQLENKMYKVTSLLSATPISTEMVFTEALNWPQQLVLHPLRNKADDYHLYVINGAEGNILLYDSSSELDEVFIDVNSASGYRPHGIAFASNGSIIIAAQDGLKTSCCVESFNPVTDLPHASCAEKEESFSATTTVAVFPDHLQLQSKTTTRRLATSTLAPPANFLATSTLAPPANFLSITKTQTLEENLESSMNESITVTLVVNASYTGSDSPVANNSEPPSTAFPQQHSHFVSLGIEPTTAKAVTASASTAVTATSVVSSPQVATSGVRIGMLSGPVSCRYIEELEDPDLLQFAFPLSLDFGDPNSPTKVWTGSALVTAVLLVVFCGITSLVSLANLSSTTLLELLASIEATLLGYFLPSIVEAALVIPREHSHVGEIVVGFSSAVVSFALLIAFSYRVARSYVTAVKVEQLRDPVSDTPKINFENTSEESKFVERYGPYFDRCRDPDKLLTRCSFFIDVFVSCLVGAASGFRAKSGCTGLAIFLLLLCLANLIFNLWLRPTRYKLDLIFLIIFSVVMLVQSVLALLIVVSSGSLSEALLKVYDVVLFIAYIGFMVQLVVTAFWSVAVRQRRKVRRQTSEQMQGAAASVLNVPLVPVGDSVQDDDVTPSVVCNPLQQ